MWNERAAFPTAIAPSVRKSAQKVPQFNLQGPSLKEMSMVRPVRRQTGNNSDDIPKRRGRVLGHVDTGRRTDEKFQDVDAHAR